MRTPALHWIGRGIFRYSVRIGPQFAGLACQAGTFSPLDAGGFLERCVGRHFLKQ